MKIQATISYERGTQIGSSQGLNSEVYMARDPQLDGEIVVKEIPKANINAAAYFHEAQATYASFHRNVVPVHYACETPTHVCLAMPFFSRGSLQDRLEPGGLPLSEAIRVVDGVLSGLGHVHTQQLVHFDVKPTNVFFDDTDTPLVADFGQASPMVFHGIAYAPPIYANAFPPEVLANGAASATADIYQAALTLYRALHGEWFYRAEVQRALDRFDNIRAAIVQGKFPDRSRFLPHVPRYLKTIIRKALSVDPSTRYQTAHEFAGALARVKYTLDWQLVSAGPDLTWRAQREGKRDFVVQLNAESQNHWAIEAYTENGKRRRTAAARWEQGLTREGARKSLSEMFKELNGRG